jgi:glutathione S-transferase
MLIVYGTVTSPYVRRVRVVAHELGLEYELVDVSSDAGQAELRRRSPIWKIPAAELDGELVFDSRVICELLVARHGAGTLANVDGLADRNAITVVDGALDSLINCFYLARDGVDSESVAYLRKQQERAASAMTWIDAQIHDGWLSRQRSFALPEIALATAAGWMRFRDTYPIDRHPGVLACLERCEMRQSFASTQPHAQVVTK